MKICGLTEFLPKFSHPYPDRRMPRGNTLMLRLERLDLTEAKAPSEQSENRHIGEGHGIFFPWAGEEILQDGVLLATAACTPRSRVAEAPPAKTASILLIARLLRGVDIIHGATNICARPGRETGQTCATIYVAEYNRRAPNLSLEADRLFAQ